MARHRHTPHRHDQVSTQTAAAPQPPPQPHGRDWSVWGQRAIAVFYLGGFALLFLAMMLQVGPSAFMAGWQVRHWGGDNVIVSFLPGFVVLVGIAFLPRVLPRAPDGTFLRGLQQGLVSDRPVQPPSPERMARVLLLLSRGALIASGLFLLAGGLGYELITRIGDDGAGAPLPALTLSAITKPGAALPPFARLAGATVQSDWTWRHVHSERSTVHQDAWTPLTAAEWQPGDPVAVLEEDRNLLDRDAPDAAPLPPGPIEGGLERGAVPDWLRDELRRNGIAVTDDPVVLVRRPLNGVVPGADVIGAVLCLAGGAIFTLLSLVIAFGYHIRRRRILRDLAAGRA